MMKRLLLLAMTLSSLSSWGDSINPDKTLHGPHFLYRKHMTNENNDQVQVTGLKHKNNFPTRTSGQTRFTVPRVVFENEQEIGKSIFRALSQSYDLEAKGQIAHYGTAVFVGGNTILTNFHVYDVNYANTKSCKSFKILVQSKIRRSPIHYYCKKIYACYKPLDYCLIEMKPSRRRYGHLSRHVSPLKFVIDKNSLPDTSEQTLSIGNGYGLGLQASWGISFELLQNDSLIKHYAPLFPGFSGGPLIDSKNRVFGLTYAQSKVTFGPDAHNFARPIWAIYEHLKHSRNINQDVLNLFEISK